MQRSHRVNANHDSPWPTAPISLLTGEVLDISFLLGKYWEPLTPGRPPRPRIISALNDSAIGETVCSDLREHFHCC